MHAAAIDDATRLSCIEVLDDHKAMRCGMRSRDPGYSRPFLTDSEGLVRTLPGGWA